MLILFLNLDLDFVLEYILFGIFISGNIGRILLLRDDIEINNNKKNVKNKNLYFIINFIDFFIWINILSIFIILSELNLVYLILL